MLNTSQITNILCTYVSKIKFSSRDKIFNALRQIRAEGTDEFLISFFFQSATTRMEKELAQKRRNTNLGLFLF